MTKQEMVITFVKFFYRIYFYIPNFIAKISKTYYFEDYFRVYPNNIAYYVIGIKRKASKRDQNNFLNHAKFYKFAAQFVKGKKVADIGCGSGYGCEILRIGGKARRVYACDISKQSIAFAKQHYSKDAIFSIQGITDLKKYPNNSFDFTLCSEVIEHIREYSMEDKAIEELKRITKDKGLIVIGTPNEELVKDHGLTYEQIVSLMKKHFKKFCIFENALIPTGKDRSIWKKRLAKKQTGIIISEIIKPDEVAMFDVNTKLELKKGQDPGTFRFTNKYTIDTTLLHNTHSWVILAVKN